MLAMHEIRPRDQCSPVGGRFRQLTYRSSVNLIAKMNIEKDIGIVGMCENSIGKPSLGKVGV